MNPLRAPNSSPLLACGAVVLLLALVAPVTAFADASPPDGAAPGADGARIRPLVGVLLTGTISNGSTAFTNPDGSVVTGNLGGRYEAFAGAEFPVDPNGLALRLTLGIHTATLAGGVGSEHFTSFPLEATLWYPLDAGLRVGAGARYSARMRFSGPGRHTSDHLDAAPGVVLGIGYRVLPHLWLDLRYDYERFEQAVGADVDASHFGIGVTAVY